MNILFSVYVNKYNNLHEFKNDAVFQSKKIATKVIGEIKKGFTSFLKSISNSFVALKKMFSFSGGDGNFKKTTFNEKVTTSRVSENKVVSDAKYSDSVSCDNFKDLKDSMHEKLKFLLIRND